MAQVAKRPILQGMTFDGRRFVGNEVEHEREFARGQGNVSFTIDVLPTGPKDSGASYGFASEDDMRRFIRSFDEQEYTGYNQWGEDTPMKLTGFGLPDALIGNLRKTANVESKKKNDAEKSNDAEMEVTGSEKDATYHGAGNSDFVGRNER